MKATDFNFQNDILFNPETGITSFKDTRLTIFDANAIGLLRQNIIEEFGFEKAKTLFLRFGFQNGYSDFMQMKLNYEFDTEIDSFAAGPVIHTWEGIVKASPTAIEIDKDNKKFLCTGIWTNSYEAEQHLTFNEISKESICWSLVGYASGWSTAFFGSPVVATEPLCIAKGDPHCEWKLLDLASCGEEAKINIEALRKFFK